MLAGLDGFARGQWRDHAQQRSLPGDFSSRTLAVAWSGNRSRRAAASRTGPRFPLRTIYLRSRLRHRLLSACDCARQSQRARNPQWIRKNPEENAGCLIAAGACRRATAFGRPLATGAVLFDSSAADPILQPPVLRAENLFAVKSDSIEVWSFSGVRSVRPRGHACGPATISTISS